ncbi:ATP-binding protein [Roseomonas mucosa]|uniref:ATP-binding protein n=1 Tax=Roseomonas mucosa TaxID=207340 RepID=UPI001EF44657|nr:ATP-binding protein [Roseomonas mucosa]MCG7354236.1 ATP-binding protein [Roseomonas mucosa]
MTHTPSILPATSVPIARIRGALGEKVLRKSPELFNQSLPTVLAEVLQNARRAGATRVEIEHFGEEGRATLVVRDDGHGIADMGKLVTFGASAWDERTDLVENAAGMGVFSLASRGVTVRSLGRRVTLSRAVFCGEADAAVLPDPGMDAGTELTFPVTEAGVARLVERACRFYPLPVTLNGKPLEQNDFLAGAEHVVEWQGLRLGVFREPGPQVLDLFDRHRGWSGRLYLNFHGHVVECGTAVALAEVGGPTRSVFVDVMSAPDLRLVLPARNEPIDNDFFRAMRARADRRLCWRRLPGNRSTRWPSPTRSGPSGWGSSCHPWRSHCLSGGWSPTRRGAVWIAWRRPWCSARMEPNCYWSTASGGEKPATRPTCTACCWAGRTVPVWWRPIPVSPAIPPMTRSAWCGRCRRSPSVRTV